MYPTDRNLVQRLHDKTIFQDSLGKEKHYASFLAFFQQEIDAKGVGAVLNEYVFAGDEKAESMLLRLFGGLFCPRRPVIYQRTNVCFIIGLIHPFIHFGFGIEFNQPAIVAQALAQTAVHKEGFGRNFFLPAEQLAGGIGNRGSKSLLQLLNEIRADAKLKESVKYTDPSNIADGVLTRAPQEMLKYASQYTVSADQVDERLVDLINTAGKLCVWASCSWEMVDPILARQCTIQVLLNARIKRSSLTFSIFTPSTHPSSYPRL